MSLWFGFCILGIPDYTQNLIKWFKFRFESSKDQQVALRRHSYRPFMTSTPQLRKQLSFDDYTERLVGNYSREPSGHKFNYRPHVLHMTKVYPSFTEDSYELMNGTGGDRGGDQMKFVRPKALTKTDQNLSNISHSAFVRRLKAVNPRTSSVEDTNY